MLIWIKEYYYARWSVNNPIRTFCLSENGILTLEGIILGIHSARQLVVFSGQWNIVIWKGSDYCKEPCTPKNGCKVTTWDPLLNDIDQVYGEHTQQLCKTKANFKQKCWNVPRWNRSPLIFLLIYCLLTKRFICHYKNFKDPCISFFYWFSERRYRSCAQTAAEIEEFGIRKR